MPLSTEQVPNKPLNGEELLEIAVQEFRTALKRQWHFHRQQLHRRVAFDISVRFHFGHPLGELWIPAAPTAAGAIEGVPPLANSGAEESEVLALDISVPEIDNPNLQRVAAGLPITVAARVSPKPGEMFGAIAEHQVQYEPDEFPKPPEPKVEDVSEAAAAKMGVTTRKRRGQQ